jgi:hypothetical protein
MNSRPDIQAFRRRELALLAIKAPKVGNPEKLRCGDLQDVVGAVPSRFRVI